MDSGTSGGSMQSGSSGEDDQIDSSFSPAASSIPHLHHILPPQTHQLHQQPFLFSSQNLQYPPLTNTTSLYTAPSNSLLQSDLDRIWSAMTVNQNQQMNTLFYSATSLPASSNNMTNHNNPQTTTRADPHQLKLPSSSTISSVEPHLGKKNGSTSGRFVKKRTRASRKTPTTVLTTDTTNFRAMVQEFTGIPTPPFGPSSLFPAKKLDLFGQNNNNGLDPSLACSLLYSLNKSTNPFAPPQISNNPFARNINPNSDNTYHHQEQQSPQQMMTSMMLSSGSNIYGNVNATQQAAAQNQNPNLALFQASAAQPLRPPFPSKYSGEQENVSGTG